MGSTCDDQSPAVLVGGVEVSVWAVVVVVVVAAVPEAVPCPLPVLARPRPRDVDRVKGCSTVVPSLFLTTACKSSHGTTAARQQHSLQVTSAAVVWLRWCAC